MFQLHISSNMISPQSKMINIQFLIRNLVKHFPYLMFTSTVSNREKSPVSHDQQNTKICKRKSSHHFFISLLFDRKSNCYIYHVVWYCDTCFSIVYGTRTQNSSLIQLYEIQSGNNDNIIFKPGYREETRKGYLLPRFLKPFFSPLGTYGFIIRFDSSNTGKAGQKAHPYIARIHFDQLVGLMKLDFCDKKRICLIGFSILRSMPNHRRIFMLMKYCMWMIPIISISQRHRKIIPSNDKYIGRKSEMSFFFLMDFDR